MAPHHSKLSIISVPYLDKTTPPRLIETNHCFKKFIQIKSNSLKAIKIDNIVIHVKSICMRITFICSNVH